jgi:putative chitinase
MPDLITSAVLKQIFPGADDARIGELQDAFNQGSVAFQVDTPLRKAHFFAQVLEEVGQSASTREENMNYASTALGKLFSYFRSNPAEAEQYGRTSAHAANQQAIANRAYADKLGNGNVASGDGWRYRGKGYIQLTGKANYQSAQAHIDSKLPGSGINIIVNEADILSVKGAMFTAMAFFSLHNIDAISDTGSSDAIVDKVTAVVNKNTPSYADRRAHFHQMKVVFQVQ